jgi:hypothetical protein
MDRSLLIRDLELVTDDISMGRNQIGSVFIGDLEADECLSKYQINSRSPLNDICFSIFIDVTLIYDIFVL